MKRKLALMLAGVMMLASVPMNLSAAGNASIRVRGNAINSADYTLFYERDYLGNFGSGIAESGKVSNRSGTLEYYTSGADLVITVDDTVTRSANNEILTLTLENAEWFFRNSDSFNLYEYELERIETGFTYAAKGPRALADAGITPQTDTTTRDTITRADILGALIRPAIATAVARPDRDVYDPSVADNRWTIGTITPTGTARGDYIPLRSYNNSYHGNGLPQEPYMGSDSWNPSNSLINAADEILAPGYERNSSNTPAFEWQYLATGGVNIQTTAGTPEDMRFLVPDVDAIYEGAVSNDSADVLVRTTYDPTKGFLAEKNGKFSYFRHGDYDGTNYEPSSSVKNPEVPYRLEFSGVDSSVAHLYLLEDAISNSDGANTIVIPIVSLTTERSADVRVSVDVVRDVPISSNVYTLATSAEGDTNTYADDIRSARNEFNLYDIIIAERRPASIDNGTFELIAPTGYFWGINDLKIFAEVGLRWASHPNTEEGNPGTTSTGGDYYVQFRNTNNGKDESILEITLNGLQKSTTNAGKIYLRGLKLYSEDSDDNNVGKELSARIRNKTSNDKVVSSQTFKIAKVTNYTVSLTKRTNNTPELVSGRLSAFAERATGSTEWAINNTINDDYHKTDKVRFTEELADSWWGTSKTVLSLPEGVNFLKVEIDEIKNINNYGIVEEKAYYNNHRKTDTNIEINDNTLAFSNLNNNRTGKARFDMDIWVNIEVDFEGDVDLSLTTVSTRAGEDEDQSVTIATAIVPVEIETTVADVRIGYQTVPVADFDIIETAAGNLLKGKQVYVSVSDLITTDMAIAPGFSYEVSDGDMKISNVRTSSYLGSKAGEGAHIRFTIDRVSTEASTVSFKNVEVKIDRTVPYSNTSLNDDRGIKVVAWGPAIAENYEGLHATDSTSYDFFTTPGIYTSYINVTSSPTGTETKFTNVVKVTIGNPVAIVNDQEYTMPVAAYVSEASQSTMIPLRFISYALGLEEEAVIWDPNNGTITVDGGSRTVQFQVGQTTYRYNGMDVPMLSPEGLPVACEIKDERSFVPFRALGDAFGIPVGWKGETSTAIYNSPEDL